MKKIILLLALFITLGSCQKEEISPIKDESSSIVSGEKALRTEYAVSPKFGRPSSTNYYFRVYDVSGTVPLSVKFYERATGTITYSPMTRSGSYWILTRTIAINGWYDYRYVYSVSKANISANAYVLCNTKNVFVPNNSSGINKISWPFGADGSSWTNRTVLVNGSYQTWRGGEEGGSGNGWGDGFHTGPTEQYSDDWNRGIQNQDENAEIRTPLDGYVAAYGTYPTTLGPSKYVAIVQETNGKTYRFYVGHLNAIEGSLYVGKYVRAGVNKIGLLGRTGADSPHAHTSLRDVTGGASTSVPFYFNAQ